tara:strand:- start:269 stop:535 length:267 start_codon:yes stop_codon:yes gene_type:complete
MAKKRANKKIQKIEVDAIPSSWSEDIKVESTVEPKVEEVIQVTISEEEQIKIQLKEIQLLLNLASQVKNRTELITRQMGLQIKLKNLK